MHGGLTVVLDPASSTLSRVSTANDGGGCRGNDSRPAVGFLNSASPVGVGDEASVFDVLGAERLTKSRSSLLRSGKSGTNDGESSQGVAGL